MLEKTTDRDEVISLCRRLGKAHAEKDADAIVACYAPGAVIHGLAPPLSERGLSRDDTAAWLETWEGPVLVDASDVELELVEGLAWSTALNRMRGRKVDGEEVDLWFRTTLCFRRIEGEWRIVHDHASVPFYMDGSFRAATDLYPEDRPAWDSAPDTGSGEQRDPAP